MQARTVTTDDGEVVAEDIYVYTSGEMFTQTVRRLLIPILATGNGKFGNIDPEELKTLGTLGELGTALRGGEHKAAVAAYRQHHQHVWPEVVESLHRAGVERLEIHLLGRRLVMIVELRDGRIVS